MKEPFINHMFPGCPGFPPDERDYKKRTKKVVLYSYLLDSDPRCKYCWEEDCDNDCEDALLDKEEKNEEVESKYNFYNKDQPKIPDIDFNKLNLQSLLDILPEGVSPKDIKFGAYTLPHDMNVEFKIEFYYTKTFEADPEGYKRDKAIYDDCRNQYEKEREKYENWKKEEEIKNKEIELQQLKNNLRK